MNIPEKQSSYKKMDTCNFKIILTSTLKLLIGMVSTSPHRLLILTLL